MGSRRSSKSTTLRLLLSLSISFGSLVLVAFPKTGLAGTDESCLARVKKEAWKGRPLRIELEDGRRLELRSWEVQTKTEAGIDTSGVPFGGGALSLVPAQSIRRIEYAKPGTNWGGRIGIVVLGAAGVALLGHHESAPPPAHQTFDEALGDAFDDMTQSITKPILGALVGGLVGYFVGTAVFPPRAEPRSVECSAPESATAMHATSMAPAFADSATVAGGRP